ncbi:hypothetical protein Rhopal_001733-T1 [Rhodotorula paludigena]|uniref:Uncharacterized protein n=1 Tax=Rhodotorula paludigena TaxID=86838 RepID=A0AAV5GE23_9BASI|nr:hypothetical protein Rhopal_001733-T1 [Rhodotorula paludigena]
MSASSPMSDAERHLSAMDRKDVISPMALYKTFTERVLPVLHDPAMAKQKFLICGSVCLPEAALHPSMRPYIDAPALETLHFPARTQASPTPRSVMTCHSADPDVLQEIHIALLRGGKAPTAGDVRKHLAERFDNALQYVSGDSELLSYRIGTSEHANHFLYIRVTGSPFPHDEDDGDRDQLSRIAHGNHLGHNVRFLMMPACAVYFARQLIDQIRPLVPYFRGSDEECSRDERNADIDARNIRAGLHLDLFFTAHAVLLRHCFKIGEAVTDYLQSQSQTNQTLYDSMAINAEEPTHALLHAVVQLLRGTDMRHIVATWELTLSPLNKMLYREYSSRSDVKTLSDLTPEERDDPRPGYGQISEVMKAAFEACMATPHGNNSPYFVHSRASPLTLQVPASPRSGQPSPTYLTPESATPRSPLRRRVSDATGRARHRAKSSITSARDFFKRSPGGSSSPSPGGA